MNIPNKLRMPAGALIASMALPAALLAQAGDSGAEDEDEVFVLSPFEVSGESTNSYSAASTLAGNRLNTELKDLGTSLSVYTEQFLEDVGATDNSTLLNYTLGTEVGGVNGNYSGSGGGINPNTSPQSSNRVRGLVSADNTRDLYVSSIPWDGYNIDGVDIQRGPNSILFGQGSPGGVINTRIKHAKWENSNEVSIRVDEYGSIRGTIDLNRVIIEDELAVRVSAVDNRTNYKQKPAFNDFQRQYFALRYAPSFLQGENARTMFKANVEFGDGNSNQPRNMPPRDKITPWFTELGQQTFNTAWANDNNWEIPGRGAATLSKVVDEVTIENPNYQEWIGNSTGGTGYGNGYFAGSWFFFEPNQTTPALGLTMIPNQSLGIRQDGQVDGNVGGLADGNPLGITGYREWAAYTNQPFETLAKDWFITDPTVFDFYNNLLDGDIKREWMNFESYDASLSQTFFGDSMGFDIGYHQENYLSGGYSPVSDTIYLDVNERWADGTNTPATGWYTDGSVNVGAGRPFVQLGNGAGEGVTKRESWRATAFLSHNFDKNDGNWFTRILGKHTLTGMGSNDDYARESRSWVRSTFVGDYYENEIFEDIKDNNGRFWADFVPLRGVYLTDSSLQGKTLGQNLGIGYPTVDPVIGDTVTVRYFDSHWKHPMDPSNPNYVDPAAVWFNQVTAGTPDGPAEGFQADNPENYVGWVTREVQLLTDADPANREALTNGHDFEDRYNEAYGFTWQSKFWDESIIATIGWRHDEVGSLLVRNNFDGSTNDPDANTEEITELGPFEEESDSWGIVAHTNRMPLIAGFMEKLPVEISLSYNKSNNFQTGQQFNDYWGQELPLPLGETEDIGVLIADKSGRYSVKINQFESKVANNVGSSLAFWLYGNNVGIYAQAYHQIKNNYRDRSQPNSPSFGSGIVSDLPAPTNEAPNDRWNFDYAPLPGQTLAEAEALEVAVINAWDQWLEEMAPLPQLMASAWSFAWDGTDFTEQGSSFRFTENILAEGYELELHANVTDNWRMTVNASKIKSYRDEIGQTLAPGGEITLVDYLLDFNDRLNNSVMGDLRIWGPGGGANARDNWNGYADGDLKARLAEQGAVVPENRLWHVNFVTNYDFTDGKFDGWSVGGSARYQSALTLAYKPVNLISENTGNPYLAYDLDSPFKDSSETNFDVWIGYKRKIFGDKVDWRAQLNISNVGVGEELVPVTVQPDGTPAAYRIRPPQQIFLTNTFSF